MNIICGHVAYRKSEFEGVPSYHYLMTKDGNIPLDTIFKDREGQEVIIIFESDKIKE